MSDYLKQRGFSRARLWIVLQKKKSWDNTFIQHKIKSRTRQHCHLCCQITDVSDGFEICLDQSWWLQCLGQRLPATHCLSSFGDENNEIPWNIVNFDVIRLWMSSKLWQECLIFGGYCLKTTHKNDEHISRTLKNNRGMLKAISSGCCHYCFFENTFSNYIYSCSTGSSAAVKGRMSFILSAWGDILSATARPQQESVVRFRERSKFKSFPSGLKSLSLSVSPLD